MLKAGDYQAPPACVFTRSFLRFGGRSKLGNQTGEKTSTAATTHG
jgi:hypothetical protein